MYAALASQKQHMTIHLMAIYASDASRNTFESAYKATGKRFDVGKSCVRFRTLDDLPLPVIGNAIASMTVDEFVRLAEAARSARKAPAAGRRTASAARRR